ncbi:MAG: metallophosphoesterase family protein [Leptolyngbyaceae cyanobacterium bins.349]|nr:metallophosphoesterase family protein [Leptolyngbyaceae cyanobacterium bins.349]
MFFTQVAIALFSWLLTMTPAPTLLTDPFLQLPGESSVHVVWFTEFEGTQHTVRYGKDLKQTAIAKTTKLRRTREDQNSNIPHPPAQPTARPIWRHEAEVTNLPRDTRLPYQVTSVRADGKRVTSETFTLAAAPSPGRSLKVLLTSDHQLKSMVAANLQKAIATVGPVDLVLVAGDLINIPDRASEWFDDAAGGAFFPALQGRAQYDLKQGDTTTRYTGAAILQHTPMYAAIGNHEVMGRFSTTNSLNEQYGDAVPRAIAQDLYTQQAETINPTNNPLVREAWIKNHSFNTDTYEEILSLPTSDAGGKRYYAVTFGDIRLITLYVTNVWRTPYLNDEARGKYRERQADLNTPAKWGHGQHIFEAIAPGSPQYTWLQQELQSPEFQQAKYKIVMFHHPPHSLGENSVPAYTDPVQVMERDATGAIAAIRYEYPTTQDYILQDLVPLLEKSGVQLVFYGHSHLWNRFVGPTGMHFLETSNVGNSYGAFLGERQRSVPTNFQESYAAIGNPGGLEAVIPAIAPLRDETGQPLPYIASNDITAFSILDTGTGAVSSYYFDTRKPDAAVSKFDEFLLP